MSDHKFKIGQNVLVQQSNASRGAYVVTRRLPERHGEFHYQVKTALKNTIVSCVKAN